MNLENRTTIEEAGHKENALISDQELKRRPLMSETMLARAFERIKASSVDATARAARGLVFVLAFMAASPAAAGWEEIGGALANGARQGLELRHESRISKIEHFYTSIETLLNYQQDILKNGIDGEQKQVENEADVLKTQLDQEKRMAPLFLVEAKVVARHNRKVAGKAEDPNPELPDQRFLKDGFKEIAKRYEAACKNAWQEYNDTMGKRNELVRTAISQAVRGASLDYEALIRDMSTVAEDAATKLADALDAAREAFTDGVDSLYDDNADEYNKRLDQMSDEARQSIDNRAGELRDRIDTKIRELDDRVNAAQDKTGARRERIDADFRRYSELVEANKERDLQASRISTSGWQFIVGVGNDVARGAAQ